MVEVALGDGKVFIRDLVLEDKDAALLLSDLDPEERAATVLTALRLGLLMHRHARIVVNVDFVRREFEQVVTEIKNYWQDEVVKKIDKTIGDYFDVEKGTIPRRLVEYFGNGVKGGKLADLFDEKKTTSVTYQLRQIIQQELTGETSAFVKALDPDDEKTPIGRLKKRIEKPMEELRNEIIKEAGAAEMAETGTQKGYPYEDLTYTYVDRVAATFGDVVEDVSAQNVAGDYVVTLDAETVPGQTLRVALDAKDKKMGLKECETTLADAKARWAAQAALLIFARQGEAPSGIIGLRKLTEGYACVFDKESLDLTVLQAAYQIVRLEAIRSAQRPNMEVDAARVQQKLEEALQKLQDFATLKRRLTEAIKHLRGIHDFASCLRDELRDRLDEAWTALGVKAPAPAFPEEPEPMRVVDAS